MNPLLNVSLLLAAAVLALFRLQPLAEDLKTTTTVEAPRASFCQQDGVVVRGSWICEEPTCAFLKKTHGQPFRSAAPQDCPCCKTPMVQ